MRSATSSPSGLPSALTKPAWGLPGSAAYVLVHIAFVDAAYDQVADPLQSHGLPSVSRICTQIAPQAGLNTGAARTALRKAVLAAQDGSNR